MRVIKSLLLMVCIFSVSSTVAHAQGRGNTKSDAAGKKSGVDVDVNVFFAPDELNLIRAWFGDSTNLEGLPPGLAKRETLPPGLQKHLQRHGTLPPGLQSRLYSVPVELHRRLPSLKPGLSRVIIGGSILLLEDSSSLILDVAAIF